MTLKILCRAFFNMNAFRCLCLAGLIGLVGIPVEAAPKSGPVVRYRYENTVDLRVDNTLNHVVVVGYDDSQMREATRLVVSAGGAPLTLRNRWDVGGAMYAPAVEFTKNGTLIVRWGVIGDGSEQVELAADPAGNLTIVKRSYRR